MPTAGCSKYVLQTAGFDGVLQFFLLQNLPQPSSSSLPQPKPDEALVRVLAFAVPKLRLTPDALPPRRLCACACSFQNYTDYFKCIAAKGEDYAPCKQFKRAYNSLCPSEYSYGSFFPC